MKASGNVDSTVKKTNCAYVGFLYSVLATLNEQFLNTCPKWLIKVKCVLDFNLQPFLTLCSLFSPKRSKSLLHSEVFHILVALSALQIGKVES